MNDLFQAKIRCLHNNIDRYCRLLATELTEVEREFIHGRIAKERADLEALLRSRPEGGLNTPDAHIAADARRAGAPNHAGV